MKAAKVIGIIVVIVMLLGLAFGAACEGEPTRTPTPGPTLPTHDDQAFASWATKTMKLLELDLDMLGSAAGSLDNEGVIFWGGCLYEDADDALSEIDQYNVSPMLSELKTELKLALRDLREAGYYDRRGAINYDADDIELATAYIISAITHMARCNELLQ